MLIMRLCYTLLLAGLLIGHPAYALLTEAPAPEAATGWQTQREVVAKQAMAVTANPYASQAAQQILLKQGSAVDAMIAAQAVLTLVEPQSSGLGGGAFLVHWQQEGHRLTTLDGRETAPSGAPSDLFLDKEGQPLPFFDAVIGGQSVATPGTVELLWQAHQAHGKLNWQTLFEPAIQLASNGFIVSKRLATLIQKDQENLAKDPSSAAYFFDSQGVPLTAGSRLTNPALAQVLTELSQHGPKAFYQGKLARAMVDKVTNAPTPGYLSMEDLAGYQTQARAPLCAPYRQNQICGMGPPSSGTIALGQILGMLSHFDLAKLGPTHPQSWRLIADASRLAFADRNHYVADSDFVAVPVSELLDADYLKQRAELLRGQDRALPQVEPGVFLPLLAWRAPDQSPEFPSTTHLSIVDNEGNAVSMTSTIENGFGSRLMVEGFLLNNELTDFSFSPERDGMLIANRLEPNKRPRSSMAPIMVLENNQPLLIIGSPGGSSIIGYVLQSIINILDWGMTPQQAIAQGHIIHRGGDLEMEERESNLALAPMMQALGFTTRFTELNSGLHAIMLQSEQLIGAADPRREGLALAADEPALSLVK